MPVLRIDPFRNFDAMTRKMANIANQIEKGVTVERGSFVPRVDIKEESSSYILTAELPGIAKENVNISVNSEGELTLRGTKPQNQTPEGGTIWKNERIYGEFKRSFILPDDADSGKVNAKYNNGLLDIIIEKKQPVKAEEFTVEIL